jgi:hypothetical protein
VTTARDWQSWRQPYADENSALSRRLRLIQQHIALWLDERKGEPLTVVSSGAGQGHDLLGVLATRPDADRVRCTLLEKEDVLFTVGVHRFPGVSQPLDSHGQLFTFA